MPDTKYIFDVCGTLFREDTTAGLLNWHFRRKGLTARSGLMFSLFSRQSPVNLIVRVAERLAGRHFAKFLAVYLLKNETVGSVSKSAEEYVIYLMSQRRIQPVFAVFDQVRRKQPVVLASASIPPVIETLARMLGVSAVCSELEVHEGVYTGRFANDLTGGKVAALEREFGESFFDGPVVLFTDNFTDLELSRRCTGCNVVVHRPRDMKAWNGYEVSFLYA